MEYKNTSKRQAEWLPFSAVSPKVTWEFDSVGRIIAASQGRNPNECNDEMGDGYGAMLRGAVNLYPFPVQPGTLSPYPLPGWAEMASEAIAIRKRKEVRWAVSEWQEAQLELMEGLLDWTGRDWFNDDICESAKEKIRKAGRSLNNIGGFSEMIETCRVWVPREMQRQVENIWDGIGRWRS